ncbi:hypothetical protein PIB30_036806 [Stylosanthes scabra]|uniref:Mediator of RNA polymerase II transcription subunit 25 von Willebrand factor type A domain-containing protein n=1 Tax=Stylosanthes scabra TaxID=79078 RepID=A0ABU6ZB74_9FABA|nr:hypothetical protein [Stylosanthes scabra]
MHVNNSVCEVGLVVYAAKANTDEAHVKFLNWTNDMEFLLSCLPPLELIGDDSDRLVMTEGLMEAIMMFLKKPEYNGEKHCVLVAIREPLASKTLADVPVIQDGQYCGSSEQRDVDIFDVVQMFAEGNGVEESEYGVLEGRKGEIIVLFSRTFLEAHQTLLLDTLTTIDNTNFGVEAIHDVTPRRIMYSIMELPAVKTITGEATLDSHRALRLVDVPNATTTLTPERETHEEDHYSIADMIDQFIVNNNDEEEEFDGVRPNSSAPLAVPSFEDLLNPNQETIFPGKYSGRLDDVCRQALILRSNNSTTTNINEQHRNNKGKDKAILISSNDGDSSTHQAAFSSMDNNVPSVNNASSPMMMNVLESSGGGMGVPNNPIFNLGSSSSNPSHHVLESSTVAGPSPSSYHGGVSADYFSCLFPKNAELESNNSTMLHQFEQSSSSSAIVPQQVMAANNDYFNFNNAATIGGIVGYSSELLNQNYNYLDDGANYNNNDAQFPSYYYYGNDNNAIMGGNSSSSVMIPYEYGEGGGGSSSGYFTELLQTQQQYYANQGFNNQQQQQYPQLAGPSTFPSFHFHSSYLDSNKYVVFTWEGSIIASTYPTGGVSSYRAKAYSSVEDQDFHKQLHTSEYC